MLFHQDIHMIPYHVRKQECTCHFYVGKNQVKLAAKIIVKNKNKFLFPLFIWLYFSSSVH
jgi:hypothetical protein